MKVLFICKWNMGRSQIAEELFRIYSKKNTGFSAGTDTIENSNQKLRDVAPLTVRVLKLAGVDVSDKSPVRLDEKMSKSADRIVFLAGKEYLPDYLNGSAKLVFWKIKDPDGQDYDYHLEMKDKIEKLIKELVNQIG